MNGDLGFLSAAKEGFLGVADVGDGDFIAFIFVGILAGAVGSIVSMARYLKEQGSVISDDN